MWDDFDKWKLQEPDTGEGRGYCKQCQSVTAEDDDFCSNECERNYDEEHDEDL